MSKKGDLSIQIIIVAAIALLVLVVLAVLVIRAGGGIVQGTSCKGVGADCVPLGTGCGEGFTRDISKSCDNGQICCIPVG